VGTQHRIARFAIELLQSLGLKFLCIPFPIRAWKCTTGFGITRDFDPLCAEFVEHVRREQPNRLGDIPVALLRNPYPIPDRKCGDRPAIRLAWVSPKAA
jgi:hypothetical protein